MFLKGLFFSLKYEPSLEKASRAFQPASQHAKTPPGRKRLFVKVQSNHPVSTGKQKGGSLTPKPNGSLTTAGL
jgi:hypothetical protein